MFINEKHKEADILLKQGESRKALIIYNELLVDFPDHPDLYSDRGVAYLHLKMEEDCFRDLNQAVRLQPDYAFRFACRAFAKNHFGDLDGAIEDYRRAVELDPDDAIAHNNLGLLLEQKGYWNEAKERYERADKLSKMESRLQNIMDEIEKTEETKGDSEPVGTKPKTGMLKEMKKILSSRSEFRAFVSFVRNGFKLK